MTAVASPPSFASLSRPGWINGGQMVNSINSDDARGKNMFMSRKTLQRTNSSSSVSSTSSSGSASTVTTNASSQVNGSSSASSPASNGDLGQWPNGSANGANGSIAPRKRPPSKNPWPGAKPETTAEFSRTSSVRAPMPNGINGAPPQLQPPPSILNLAPPAHLMAQNGLSRPGPADGANSGRQPVLYLLSLNGSFDRKTINVPYYPETLRIGRQTNNKTVPTPANGFFDSKVLSRQHAEIWADANGKIWIRDVKSSNGTFVNGSRLSPENRESEPHELQTQDHLELGIDIVSEDQKTVVHHKVAAKVEHAGFVTPSNNILEMNLGELDPSNNNAMLPLNGLPFRGRPGAQPAFFGSRPPPGTVGAAGNAAAQQRQFLSNPITTEQIIKKLHAEMRNAKLQNQDLLRTGQFLNLFVSKEDVKNMDKPEVVAEPPKNPILTNGNISFRSDGGKTRFSDPPAPPPSQPLPEKPDSSRPGSSDLSSLKRATTERPKPGNSSPIVAENINSFRQILQLTEQLDKVKKELDESDQRMRDLEQLLNKERQARLLAEEVMQKMEEDKHAKPNGSVMAPLMNGHSEPDAESEAPVETPSAPECDPAPEVPEREDLAPQLELRDAQLAAYQATIETMNQEMDGLRGQLELFRARAEKAEVERDAERAERKSLAEMVLQIRQREEEKERRAAEKLARSRSRSRRRALGSEEAPEQPVVPANGSAVEPRPQTDGPSDEAEELASTFSQAETIQPPIGGSGALSLRGQDPAMIRTLPYASMIGVVLFGMGLMAYLNDWQLQPARLDR